MGAFFQVGESWFTVDDCSERCTCYPLNNVTCEAWRCSPAQECKVQDGQLGCVDTGMQSFAQVIAQNSECIHTSYILI